MPERVAGAVSVVTPTLDRPDEVRSLVASLAAQTVPPLELVLVDGAPAAVGDTEHVAAALAPTVPFTLRYIRHGGGTAIQRNVGLDAARGEFVAFIDDDMVLAPDFLARQLEVLADDSAGAVAAVAGYITNQYFDAFTSRRWRWYRRLHLFGTYEPGRFDWATGYPINRYMQPPHDGVRDIDFMGTNCALWRARVFDEGLRFAPFFVDYGVMEDAHLALSARRRGYRLVECGRARCEHHHSPRGRTSARRVARKTAVNYRFLFVDLVPRRRLGQDVRWWAVQGVQLVSLVAAALRAPTGDRWAAVLGKVEGCIAATRVHAGMVVPP